MLKADLSILDRDRDNVNIFIHHNPPPPFPPLFLLFSGALLSLSHSTFATCHLCYFFRTPRCHSTLPLTPPLAYRHTTQHSEYPVCPKHLIPGTRLLTPCDKPRELCLCRGDGRGHQRRSPFDVDAFVTNWAHHVRTGWRIHLYRNV